MSAQLYVVMEWSVPQDSPQVYRCLGFFRKVESAVTATLTQINQHVRSTSNLPQSSPMSLSRSDTSYMLNSVDLIHESLQSNDSTVFGWLRGPNCWRHYVIHSGKLEPE